VIERAMIPQLSTIFLKVKKGASSLPFYLFLTPPFGCNG